MAISEKLLHILVCPDNKTPLHTAEDTVVQHVNDAIMAGTLRNRAGAMVTEKIDAGLIRKDGKYLYAIREDIPIMLIDEAIPLEHLR